MRPNPNLPEFLHLFFPFLLLLFSPFLFLELCFLLISLLCVPGLLLSSQVRVVFCFGFLQTVYNLINLLLYCHGLHLHIKDKIVEINFSQSHNKLKLWNNLSLTSFCR